MKIIVAKTAGFCEGVAEAVERARQVAADAGEVHSLGPLVHNPQVIEQLESNGVHVAESPDEIDSGTVVIRSHGVPPALRKQLKDKGLTICDATCKRVAKVHGLVKKYHGRGYLVIVLGDPGHAEVEGISGYAYGKAIVVSKPGQVRDLPDAEKVCLVVQTTQDREIFEQVVAELHKRYPGLGDQDLVINNTICHSTRERQAEVRKIAAEVEAMIVVGGKGSANTTRLAQIAEQSGIPTFHVETEDELDLARIRHFSAVGLTAGASTPDWMIKRVLDMLESLGSR